MQMQTTLQMARDRAQEDYQEKAAEVAQLARRGLKRQAYESMKTAKQYKQDWETRHAMHEAVERIKSRLIAQQHNLALFSSFAEANESLTKMLEEVPLERVERVLDDISERMRETHEISTVLGSPATENAVDDDELADFLKEGGDRGTAAETFIASPLAPMTGTTTATQRMLME